MTMFNKVFGSQMAASQEPDESVPPTVKADVPPPEATIPEPVPMFRPTSRVLNTREQEIAERRAESEEARLWRERSEASKDVAPPPQPSAPPPPMVAPAQPVQPVSPPPIARPAGNARTRLLGFGAPEDSVPNPMAGPVATPQKQQFPTGWVAVIDGPGRGHFFPLFSGVSAIGRDETQVIALCFGDMAISRENHAAIAYDSEDNSFYVGHGGKSNIVRLNGRPLLSTEPLSHGDTLRVGETVLRFAAFCGPDFDWTSKIDD